MQGDLRSKQDVCHAVEGADCVWHAPGLRITMDASEMEMKSGFLILCSLWS